MSQFIRDMRLRTISIPDQFNLWLAKLPTVQYQALISSLLAFGTTVVYWICMLKEIKVDPVNLVAVLAFIAAYGRINYASPFKVKRESYNPNIESKQNTQEPTETT